MPVIYDLPVPESSDLERSKTLSTHIQHAISASNGFISFSHYMNLVLYHPEFGYYNGTSFTLGKEGDFTTAPELSPVFAKTFARSFSALFRQLAHSSLLELGAGTGRFAGETLKTLQASDCLPDTYLIYEPSAGLRKKQAQFIASRYPGQFKYIQWIDQLPTHFQGIIFANEVLDALPVDCFRIDKNGISERGVTWDGNHFVWAYQAAHESLAQQACARQVSFKLPVGYESEINLAMPELLTTVANCLSKGIILFADYGYGQTEYFHPGRNKGTLTCFYRHRHHDDPFILPGLQDITAHVDFTHLAETGIDQGLTMAGYTTQTGYLLENGLTDLISEEEKSLAQVEIVNLHQAVKTLTMPTEMGERVKVMAFTKQFDQPLSGFRLQDRRRDL